MDSSLGLTATMVPNHQLLIYPNPAEQFISVKLPLTYTNSKKLLMDGYGRIIHETISDTFDLSNLSPGIYFISVPAYSSALTKVMKR